MARITKHERRKKAKREALLGVLCIMRVVHVVIHFYLLIIDLIGERPRERPRVGANPNFYQHQIDSLNRLVRGSDKDCHDQLRVNRHTFMTLCQLLEQGGLKNSRNVTVVEKVAIFLWIISHHTKNRRTTFQFWRSGETISRHFHAVLIAVLRLHNVLWHPPQPILANEPDSRWKWFEVHICYNFCYCKAFIDYRVHLII